MENNQKQSEKQNVDLSFMDDSKSPTIHLKDVLFSILRNLHWLVLCGALGAIIAAYQVRRENKVYASSAKVMIKSNTSAHL